jgi:hypothetical protein
VECEVDRHFALLLASAGATRSNAVIALIVVVVFGFVFHAALRFSMQRVIVVWEGSAPPAASALDDGLCSSSAAASATSRPAATARWPRSIIDAHGR